MHGAVTTIGEWVVIVFTSVIVTGVGDGVLTTVTTEPEVSVEVDVTGAGVEVKTRAETGVLYEDLTDEELVVITTMTRELEDTELELVELFDTAIDVVAGVGPAVTIVMFLKE